MGLIDKLTAFLPFGKKEEILKYFFALNISTEQLTTALWTIEGKELKILQTAEQFISSNDEIKYYNFNCAVCIGELGGVIFK